MTNMRYPFQSSRAFVSNAVKGVFALVLVCVQLAYGGTAPSMIFYVPFPEADALTALTAVETGGAGAAPINPMTTAISIAAMSDATIIYFDHWEDGYESDHDYASPLQASTQVWGDGNTANGFPPGMPNDLINAGTVILLTNMVTTTSPQTIDYDARDKIAATRTISVTRTYWASASGTLFAGCVETFDTGMWGTEYRAPIGINIADNVDGQMFEYTALSIMAARDNTIVRIDADNNGVFEATNTLNEGQTTFVSGVNVGGRVLADKPLQVILFSGDVGSNYESRDSSLLPISRWGSNYYSPVSTPNTYGTRVWLYNPGASAITVTNSYRVGTGTLSGGSVNVGAGAVVAVTLTENASYRFFTANGSPFYAYSTTDATDTTNFGNNQAYDWSYTLIPKELLSPQVLIGLGIGRDPTSGTNPTENGNPIWVTTVGNGESNITVYVDYDGDNLGANTDPNGFKYDISYSLKELQQQKIYDSDGDQTAMMIYVLSTNVSLAVAWGQDPLLATAGAPGLDVGTSIPPNDVFDTAKDLTVIGDSNNDGQLGPGERARYTIRIGNAARAPIPADFIITDTLPVDTTYVAGSTYYRTSTNGAWVAVADNGSGTAFPLDVTGYRLQAQLPVKGTFELQFDVDVDSYANLTPGAVSIINTGTVHAVVYNRTLTFRNDTGLHGSLGDRVWNDADNDGVQDLGEAGINGVVVYLDVNTNGVRDVSEPYDTTSGDGNYLLTGTFLEAGTHRVRVDRTTLASDFLQTFDVDGTNTANVATVTLAAGQERTDVDFGYRSPARLGDFVWEDINLNGQQDAGEPGVSNVVVRLYTNNVLIATTTSSATGAYVFTNLFAGTYTVAFTPPAGYFFTASNVGADASDSDPLAGTNRTAAVTLAGAQNETTIDAGFYQLASLSGAVRVDLDGDGVIDVGDTTGIAGVTISLLDAGSNVVAMATTSGSGDYAFSNLTPGNYTVVQTLPSGFTNTVDVLAPNDLRIPRTLTSGQNSTGNDFYDARSAAPVSQNKILYLSDSGQALDRIDPVAAGDSTTTNTSMLTAGAGGTATITLVGSAVASNTTTTTAINHSFTYNSGNTGNNRILMVGISYRNNDSETVTNVTYGGQAMTQVGTAEIAAGTPDGRIYIYRLLNPPTGSNVLLVNWDSALNNGGIVGAVTYSGVNQTGTFASLNSVTTSTTPNVTVPSAAGQLVFGVVSGRSTSAYTVTGGGTSLWSNVRVSGETAGSAQIKTGSSPSTNLTWSGSNDEWVAGGVSLIPASTPGNSTTLFTQSPAFELPFSMAAGTTVLITNFVNITSGTMPPTPAITARLSAGGSVFLTLSNPAYNSGSGTLVWSGSLGSAVAISAGQAISLSVSNAQSGVEFQIRYDSATYPSKIILPTSSIIAIPSLAVYDAAYPGGSPVTESQITAMRYVRVTVTDPFGAYDITSAGLVIDGPGASGDISTSLTDAHVVSSNVWSKTYEYAWQTIANAGTYSLTVTANEGSEGITAEATTTELLYASAFGDRVWTDLDGDGSFDAFESGIAGVRVYVDANGNNSYNAGEPMSVTAADGSYLIGNLVAGSYTARVDVATLPAGLAQTYDLNGALDHAATVTLLSNQTRTDVDFGYRPTADYVIRGQVRDDYDLDGSFSDPDLPVGGVTVTLFSDPDGDGDPADGIALTNVMTTADGRYFFTNVLSGAYVVVESDPKHSVSTADTVAANDNRIPVLIVNADSNENNFLDAVDPSGYFYDVTDGRIVPGGSIAISGPGAHILMDGSSGQYMFISSNSVETTFTIAVTPPPGYIIDTRRPAQPGSFDPTGGPNPTVLGSYESSTNQGYLLNYSAASNTFYYTFTLAPGDPAVINNNFPLVRPSALGDFVWEDLDGDGVQDIGEPGMTNITVRLLDASSNVVHTTVTDINGTYSFTNLFPETYIVQVAPPSQYIFTLPNTSATNDLYDSDVEASGLTAPFSLPAGTTDISFDAGLTLPARIYGYAFLDINTNLVRTSMVDYPIAGMTVTLWRAGVQVASTVTDSDGTARYEFNNLVAGDYTIRFAGDTNMLVAVPTNGPALTDPERNRAAIDGQGTIAIAVTVQPGEGVTSGTEPKNAGFQRPERPFSDFVSIRAYSASDGVRVEFTTAGEAGYGLITLWVWLDGGWVEIGSTLSMGFGSNTYSFNAPGLQAGESYYFRVQDEVGYLYDLYGVPVTPFAMEMQLMDRTGVLLKWESIPGRSYQVYSTKQLGAAWNLLDVVFADEEITYLEVKTDPADRQRFFKIVMVRDEVIE